jgi:Zn-dependent protease
MSRPTPEVRGLLLFRVAGVPVVLAPSWWIGSLVIVAFYTPLVARLLPGRGELAAVAIAASFTVLLGLSVLAHELGHCLVALAMGLGVRRLRLFLLGGITEVTRTPRKPPHEGVVAAAGPAVSVVLGLAFGGAALSLTAGTAGWLLLGECAIANLAVAVFNLLPGLPLDGGRIFRAGVWALTGRRVLGTWLAVIGAGFVAAALLVWGLLGMLDGSPGRWLRLGVCLVTGWFVIAGAGEELAVARQRSWPAGLTLAALLRPILQLPAESPVGDALAASAGRAVLLVSADGVAAGLLEEPAAARLATGTPRAPAERAAERIRPENVLRSAATGEEVLDRISGTSAERFLVVDAAGRATGVLDRRNLASALEAHRAPRRA